MVRLKLYEIDVERGTLMVRLGKGHKDRLVPLGERACAWVRRYCLEVRPELLAGDTDVMFLTDYGEPFEKGRLSELVANYLRGAGIAHGACHALRHACATHMLEGGADIRYIQAILGHSELSTTQIYTHVAIAKLQAVHALTHPARLERVQDATETMQTGARLTASRDARRRRCLPRWRWTTRATVPTPLSHRDFLRLQRTRTSRAAERGAPCRRCGRAIGGRPNIKAWRYARG